MHVPVADIAGAESEGRANSAKVRIASNVMGLAGATPALPPPYSELQLQRRRARDFAFAHFLSIFDHRALSFFWRIAEKYSWPLMAERAGLGGTDAVQEILVRLGGIGYAGARDRLDVADRSLVTLVAHLADARRSAKSIETVLRTMIGLPLCVVEATPTWMAVPETEQTRIGSLSGQFAQLGQSAHDDCTGSGGAAMVGSAVLDAQHHYTVEIGPLTHSELQDFCYHPERRRMVAQLCTLAAGLEHRASIRLLIATDEIKESRLGDPDAPIMLGWTTWIGDVQQTGGIARDCLIPIEISSLTPHQA